MGKRLIVLSMILILLLTGCAQNLSYGFAREVSLEEQTLRLSLVQAAENWLGCKEADGSHQPIIDLYNAHEPLAQGYTVKYTDQWCATFVSAAAITAELTDIIPTECGCQRQIGLFEQLDCWEEKDNYVPLPGDIIFYATTASGIGDCTDWSDHVGIVVGTNGNRIKVIEGNNGEAVRYRYLYTTDPTIRGYGLPDYASKT
jgi:hypothetical protein